VVPAYIRATGYDEKATRCIDETTLRNRPSSLNPVSAKTRSPATGIAQGSRSVERCIRRTTSFRSIFSLCRLAAFTGDPMRRDASAELHTHTSWPNRLRRSDLPSIAPVLDE
jgi:hypothetical protein